jgi:hypothetical protein
MGGLQLGHPAHRLTDVDAGGKLIGQGAGGVLDVDE